MINLKDILMIISICSFPFILFFVNCFIIKQSIENEDNKEYLIDGGIIIYLVLTIIFIIITLNTIAG